MNNDIKAFIFDMDGVLLDTETICEKTWQIVGQQMNLPNIVETFYKCLGTTKLETKKILQSHYGADFDLERFEEHTNELFSHIENTDGIALMPYAKECLQMLKDAGYRIALASSTRGVSVKRQLKNLELIGYFEVLATGELVSKSKPDPEIYLLACKMLNLLPSECVAVEDSFNGVKSATSANIRTIMIPDKVQPTKEISALLFRQYKSLEELKEFC